MFLSCEDRANLKTLQIIETEKRFRIRISSFKRGKKDDFWYLLKTQVRLDQNVLVFEVKRTCVLTKTYLRFGLNVEAFLRG